MARTRRRSSRLNAAASPEEQQEETPVVSQPVEEEGQAKREEPKQEEEKCPSCSPNNPPVETENWVRCDACKTWFHWRCAGKGELEVIDKWFCRPCLDEDSKRVITMKPPTRKSARKRTQRDYVGLHNSGQEADPHKWTRMMEGKEIKPDPFRRMEGNELNIEWLEHDERAFQEPIVIEKPEGLGMKMPGPDFTVAAVAEILGGDTPVEVIDVASQSNSPGWTLRKWADYYALDQSARDRIRNVISLEVSNTELSEMILPPRLVRELDWVEKYWPTTKRDRGQSYPKVQLYCLMGVANAWTDWHIDFAGSSVYYHIISGSKVFYFIRPTPSNLSAYERWSGTEMQNHSWLGDMVDEVFKVELTQGNTMIIPTGWIHAVFTPADTLVFGGNFLHSYNVATQLRVREIETTTHVPKKFRYPFFAKLCWYAGEKFLRDLKGREEFQPRILESVEALAEFLVSEARTMEKGAEPAKREAKEQVPGDRIKDAPALARELRWRVRLAEGYSSDDDMVGRRKRKEGGGDSALAPGPGSKRKRLAEEQDGVSPEPFRNFKPKTWDKITEKRVDDGVRTVKMARPNGKDDGWIDEWILDQVGVEGCGEEAKVKGNRNVLVKVRLTPKGVERHRVERTVEEWTWPAAHNVDQADHDNQTTAEGNTPDPSASDDTGESAKVETDLGKGSNSASTAMAVDLNGKDG